MQFLKHAYTHGGRAALSKLGTVAGPIAYAERENRNEFDFSQDRAENLWREMDQEPHVTGEESGIGMPSAGGIGKNAAVSPDKVVKAIESASPERGRKFLDNIKRRNRMSGSPEMRQKYEDTYYPAHEAWSSKGAGIGKNAADDYANSSVDSPSFGGTDHNAPKPHTDHILSSAMDQAFRSNEMHDQDYGMGVPAMTQPHGSKYAGFEKGADALTRAIRRGTIAPDDKLPIAAHWLTANPDRLRNARSYGALSKAEVPEVDPRQWMRTRKLKEKLQQDHWWRVGAPDKEFTRIEGSGGYADKSFSEPRIYPSNIPWERDGKPREWRKKGWYDRWLAENNLAPGEIRKLREHGRSPHPIKPLPFPQPKTASNLFERDFLSWTNKQAANPLAGGSAPISMGNVSMPSIGGMQGIKPPKVPNPKPPGLNVMSEVRSNSDAMLGGNSMMSNSTRAIGSPLQ